MSLLRGREIQVKSLGSTYRIIVQPGILTSSGSLLKSLYPSNKAMLISDTNVYAHYGKDLAVSLSDNNLEIQTVIIKPGERSKTIREAIRLYNRAIKAGLDRNSPIIALGGGVVGDLSGFVASTYLRGVPLVMVPTSLLSQVDSSVGGKVAVNHPAGKNLIGSIYPPDLVLIDPLALATLPERELKSGLAEIIKHGIIEDAVLFDNLENALPLLLDRDIATLAEFIYATVSSKVRVVEEDEFEKGYRRILNFGHTIGHALEAATGYRYYTHGEAVAVGMLAATEIALHLKCIDTKPAVRIKKLIYRLGIKKPPGRLTARQVIGKLNLDKKKLGDDLIFVLPDAPGKAFITAIDDIAVVKRVIHSYLQNSL